MIPPQRLPASLTPLDVALAALLDPLEPVAPIGLPLAQALGCVAAEMPPLGAHPPCDVAAADGFAFGARDLVGASSYSPLPLATSPAWVEAGDAMPQGCDCVIPADLVDQSGPWRRCWGRRYRGRAFAAPVATSSVAVLCSHRGGAWVRSSSQSRARRDGIISGYAARGSASSTFPRPPAPPRRPS